HLPADRSTAYLPLHDALPIYPTVISPLPDLAIAKTHSGNFTQGQIGATYTLTVSNVGAGPTSGAVTVTDTLPSGLTATGLAGSGWTCTLATLTCTRSDVLAAGASYPPITLTVNVAVNAPPSVTNIAMVATPIDSNPSNDSAADLTFIERVVTAVSKDFRFTDVNFGESRLGDLLPRDA